MLLYFQESQNLDLTGNVVRAVAAGSGATKHGATSSSSLKRRGNNSFEYESHLRYEGCQRSAKIDHLNPNTSYKFQLIVSNSEGCRFVSFTCMYVCMYCTLACSLILASCEQPKLVLTSNYS